MLYSAILGSTMLLQQVLAYQLTDNTSKLAYNPNTKILTTTLAGTATTSTNSYLAEATHRAAHYVVFKFESNIYFRNSIIDFK